MKAYARHSMFLLLTAAIFLHIEAREGFYKEVFMDAGVGLTNMNTLAAADHLGYEWEFISTEKDEEKQHFYMSGNENDDNGVLLYPDGEPRFVLIYTGGGYGQHAGPVGEKGILNVQDFYYHGGGYTGTCHGNYLVSNGWGYNFWPGKMKMDTREQPVDGKIPEDSPFLKYYDFGGDHLVKGIQHFQGGCGLTPVPPKTEICLISTNSGSVLEGNLSSWAYKENDTTGRMVGFCDHPEYGKSGEVMQLLAAAFNYAYDGAAPPDVKASLKNGEVRMMDKSTGDKNPAYTKIGDKQYHHFTVSLPNESNKLTVTLDADDGYDMNLYIAKDTFALAGCADYADTSKGADKTLTVPSLKSGTWYIGVECATTVTAKKVQFGSENKSGAYEYSGKLEVLNGVKYSVKAEWGAGTSILATNNSSLSPSVLEMKNVTGGVQISFSNASAAHNRSSSLSIYNAQGSLVEKFANVNNGRVVWKTSGSNVAAGMYIIQAKLQDRKTFTNTYMLSR